VGRDPGLRCPRAIVQLNSRQTGGAAGALVVQAPRGRASGNAATAMILGTMRRYTLGPRWRDDGCSTPIAAPSPMSDQMGRRLRAHDDRERRVRQRGVGLRYPSVAASPVHA
jgi:hypothetical protein